MPAVSADLTISSRWILPMNARGQLLEDHTMAVLDGRILDILPSTLASTRYAATVHVDRSQHLLLPGLINAYTQDAKLAERAASTDRRHCGVTARIAAMLQAGITCFCSAGIDPADTARAAVEQGLRALIGIPLAESASGWASSPDEYLTRALSLRDEYRGHPSIATAFAPQDLLNISDSTFGRIATLADELDLGLVMKLHESQSEISACMMRHGLRPIERLQKLGLLTPAFAAVHMVHANAADQELAHRSGIGVVLCPESGMRAGEGPPPVAAWGATGLRLGIGNAESPGLDLWGTLRMIALLARTPGAQDPRFDAWDALAAATRGGAAVLGLDAEIGTLAPGKWADLCCVDLRRPAIRCADDPLESALVFEGGRDLVSDVWVSGRHLLNLGSFTRLDWARIGERP